LIDYVNTGGKRQRLTLKNITTQKSAELAFADFRLKFERGELNLATDENITLDEALDALIKDRKRNNCSAYWARTLNYMRSTITSHLGKTCLFKSLDDDAMAEYRNHRSEVDKALPETVNKELKAIAAAGRLAIADGRIARLPWKKITYAVDLTGHQAWSYMKVEETIKLLNFLRYGGKVTVKWGAGVRTRNIGPNPKLWAITTFLLNSGARKGEMYALRWRDVDMRNKVVRLIGTKLAKLGKPAEPRYIPMNEDLIELFTLLPRGNDKDVVFPNDHNLNNDLSRALRYVGLPHFRVHDLRFTFASHLAMAGTPLYHISKLLGHKNESMSRRYAHLCPQTLANAVGTLRFSKPDSVV